MVKYIYIDSRFWKGAASMSLKSVKVAGLIAISLAALHYATQYDIFSLLAVGMKIVVYASLAVGLVLLIWRNRDWMIARLRRPKHQQHGPLIDYRRPR